MILFFSLGAARAELLWTFQQTGADVTSTLSGTIGAAWGARTSLPDVELDYGTWSEAGAGVRFPGSDYESYRVAYGAGLGYDYFQVSGLIPFPVVSGTFLSDGVVQAGSMDYLFLQFGNNEGNYIAEIDGPVGFTDVNATIVWSDTLLSDFFYEGIPSTTDVYNVSNQKLLTLQILNAEPVPEPGTWAAAALLAGGAAFMRCRKRAKVS